MYLGCNFAGKVAKNMLTLYIILFYNQPFGTENIPLSLYLEFDTLQKNYWVYADANILNKSQGKVHKEINVICNVRLNCYIC